MGSEVEEEEEDMSERAKGERRACQTLERSGNKSISSHPCENCKIRG
jgi:hypothetical protein